MQAHPHQQGGGAGFAPDAQRSQDEANDIKRRLGATSIFNLRQTYGAGFAPGLPADLRVGEVLGRLDKGSLSQLLRYLNR